MNTTDHLKTILSFANTNPKVRALLLNGSRANPKAPEDPFQDYDFFVVVQDISSFIESNFWLDFFGKPILKQLPQTMILGSDPMDHPKTFTYLMIFEDHTRVDLTLFPVDQVQANFKPESLSQVLLDKDNLFMDLPPANQSDYYILKPTEREFLEVSNEFWWISTYIVKGLCRHEILYAKDMMEDVCRLMFVKMLQWNIAIAYDFRVTVGKSSRHIQRFLSPTNYTRVLNTYSNAELNANWMALTIMAEYFYELQLMVSSSLHFNINIEESTNGLAYIRQYNPLVKTPGAGK